MTKQLEALISSIKDTIDDAILNYGESWDSALVQVGANTAVHAICSDAIGGEIVVYAADGSHESSWLCDYLESVSPENVKALIAALEQAQHEVNRLSQLKTVNAARVELHGEFLRGVECGEQAAEKRVAELEAKGTTSFRPDGGDIGRERIKEIADNPYGDEEKCWLARQVLEARPVVVPAEKELPDLYMSEYHESVGWNDAIREVLRMNADASTFAVKLPLAAQDVLAERQRQKESKGYTERRDDNYLPGVLNLAGAAYAVSVSAIPDAKRRAQRLWPWPDAGKYLNSSPKEPRAALVKAGALILAEIERMDRAAGGQVEGSR